MRLGRPHLNEGDAADRQKYASDTEGSVAGSGQASELAKHPPNAGHAERGEERIICRHNLAISKFDHSRINICHRYDASSDHDEKRQIRNWRQKILVEAFGDSFREKR